MTAYYNENDPYAAEWLRNLVSAGLIAPGDVDERSIEDVRPIEVQKYTQRHWFAGIGGWSLALRRAGFPDNEPIDTASCPCQPFSSAGEGNGFFDERHLWPSAFHIFYAIRPPRIVGEQVASSDGLAWLDLVQSDLEGTGYTFRAADICAAGVGSPNIRQRLYWVADAASRPGAGNVRILAQDPPREGLKRTKPPYRCDNDRMADPMFTGRSERWPITGGRSSPVSGSADGMAHNNNNRCIKEPGEKCQNGKCYTESCCQSRVVVDSHDARLSLCEHQNFCGAGRREEGRATEQSSRALAEDERSSPTNGFWRDVDWLFCRDDKWRSVEPSTFPLASRLPRGMGQMQSWLRGLCNLNAAKRNRIGRLRGYGNAINIETATAFIKATVTGTATFR